MELRTKARRLKMEHGLDLLIVDYLQLMQPGSSGRESNRVQEVSEISRGLKALARELSIPVLALSQLSRQTEMRGDSKEPRLSDLRESGAIEQDADVVIFLWRKADRIEETDAVGEAIDFSIAKHRNGPTGAGQLYFMKEQTRFVNLVRERNDGAQGGGDNEPVM
jgi:replicative DNA helicase